MTSPRLNLDPAQGDTDRRSLKLVLESVTGSAGIAALRVVQFARQLRYTEEECHDIEMAVREVVANAILHGNHRDPGKRVYLTATCRPSGLVISVRDEGQGFDPASVPDPLDANGLTQESGRGLFLTRAFMDEVIWRRAPGGMEVTLTKYPARRDVPRSGGRSDPAAT